MITVDTFLTIQTTAICLICTLFGNLITIIEIQYLLDLFIKIFSLLSCLGATILVYRDIYKKIRK